MTDNPEIIFKKWSKKYGDIIGFKVGERWMVALNGQEVIKEAVVKRGCRVRWTSWILLEYALLQHDICKLMFEMEWEKLVIF